MGLRRGNPATGAAGGYSKYPHSRERISTSVQPATIWRLTQSQRGGVGHHAAPVAGGSGGLSAPGDAYMSQERPSVSVIIPHWNGRHHLDDCLASLPRDRK